MPFEFLAKWPSVRSAGRPAIRAESSRSQTKSHGFTYYDLHPCPPASSASFLLSSRLVSCSPPPPPLYTQPSPPPSSPPPPPPFSLASRSVRASFQSFVSSTPPLYIFAPLHALRVASRKMSLLPMLQFLFLTVADIFAL